MEFLEFLKKKVSFLLAWSLKVIIQEQESKPLEKYATNLNTMAANGKIDPLIGRDQEIERTMQILCRRHKNNPLLVGEAERR